MDSELKKHVECRYSQRQCNKTAVEGYQLCKSHILEDKNSPFQQCGYVSSKTGRRCVQATLNSQKKDGLCLQHATKLNRTRRAASRKQQASKAVTAASLISELGGYLDDKSIDSTATLSKYETLQAAMAELASSEDSDIEERTYPVDSHLWQPDSDSESIDSENEDMFKYAELFTAEEVTRIARDKLIRLQSLYIEQFKWLHNVLRERRREYLRSTNRSDQSTLEDSARESLNVDPNGQTYKEYKAIKRYHRRYGQEALMYMKSQERRRAVCNQPIVETYHHNRYRHASKHGTKYCSAKSVKCHEKSLPFARYCLKHIESDSRQVLFRRCGFEAVKGGLACERVVVNVNNHVHCDYHAYMDKEQYLEMSGSDTETTNLEIASTKDKELTIQEDSTDVRCPDSSARHSPSGSIDKSGVVPMDTSETSSSVPVAAQVQVDASTHADEEQPEL